MEPSQTKSPNGTVSLDVATDSRDAKLNSMEFNEDHTGEQHNADYNYISSRVSPTFTDGDAVRAAATVCTQLSVDLHVYQSISDPDGTCGQQLISDPSTIMMTNEMKNSPENDTGIRMSELNESYQPSLVSSITLDPNPTYGTNVAIAPEIETEENIAYQHNLYGTSITNGSVELHSDNSSCADEARSNGLSQKQTIPETSTNTVIFDIENSVELHSCSIHSGDEMEASEQRSISDRGTMTNEMESSTENDTGIRMSENVSYQPSLVSSITLDPNPTYGTNVAIAPEIETEENIAYQHNLYGTNITNGSVELHSDNSSCADEARSNGLSQKQTIPETSTNTVIIDIENSVELHSCSIHSGDEMEASEQRSICDPGTMTNEMESSTENDTGIRMFENESYQPSLVSSITLDQNPAYVTNVAIAPEIETEENIAYQHNLNVTESINDSVEQPS